jgi:hypothetical protein
MNRGWKPSPAPASSVIASTSAQSEEPDRAFDVSAKAVPISDVERLWTSTANSQDRMVVVP